MPRLTPGFTPQIVINSHSFTVIGILRPLKLFPEINSSVLIGWDAARTQLAFSPAPTEIYLQAQQPAIEAVAGGAAVGAYPLIRAARLTPTEALAAL